MGVEDFRIDIRTSADVATAVAAVLAMAGVHGDMEAAPVPHYRYARFEDTNHIVELEIGGDAEASISVRFALCQPSTIDPVFVELVGRVARAANGSVIIAEDVLFDDVDTEKPFEPPRWEGLGDVIARCIRVRRAQWEGEFGTETARLSCKGALERYILSR